MSGSPPMRVSIVMPAYDEGPRLPALAAAIVERLIPLADTIVEIVVVDDGSSAEHAALTQEAVERAATDLRARGTPHVFRWLRAARNGGKGSAIRLGWSQADPDAEWLGWVDADGAVSAAELVRLIGLLRAHPDVQLLAGARVKMAGKRVQRRIFRHLQGRVFATITEACLDLGVYDTQCGMKLARADWARPLLPLLQENGWMLDVELLALLKARGARFAEVPIDWEDAGTSKVRFGVDPLRMLWALRRIRARAR